MSAAVYHQIQITSYHNELLQKHEETIRNVYKIGAGTLKILNVQQKIPDGTGLFYKFTIKDVAGRTYLVKIDQPLPMQLF